MPRDHVLLVPPSPRGVVLAGTLQDLIGASVEIAFAVTHVRLAALETVVPLLPMLQRCRLVLAHFNAAGLSVPAALMAERRDGLRQLLEHARNANFEVRSAGAGRWEPDLSLFRFPGQMEFGACVLGAHYLLPVDSGIEWPLTCLFTRSAVVNRASAHFESLWSAAHDVRAALISTLEQELCA